MKIYACALLQDYLHVSEEDDDLYTESWGERSPTNRGNDGVVPTTRRSQDLLSVVSASTNDALKGLTLREVRRGELRRGGPC